MSHKNGTMPKMAIITDTDGDGITSAAQAYRYYTKTGFRKKKKQHRTYECEIFYATNSTLQDRLSKIDPDTDELIITDLAVEDKKDSLDKLDELTKNNCKVTILSDKKIPPRIKLTNYDYITVESANKRKNIGKSTSLIVYDFLEEKASGHTLDNVYDSLADMGAAADGIIGGTEEYRESFEEAIKLDYAIKENKEDNQFFNNILHELANYGSIQDKELLNTIENKSSIFSNRITKAYNAIVNEKNILPCQNENYLISKIDVKKDDEELPYGLACSDIRYKKEKNIALICTGINNHTSIILRGYNSDNFSDLLEKLEVYGLKGGGHEGMRCKGFYKFHSDNTENVIKVITNFCSTPPKNET